MNATRRQLIDQAVIEAARLFMARHLEAERKACATKGSEDYARYCDAVLLVDDALQGLRDALAAESKVRVRR